jgi:hypothetical protein
MDFENLLNFERASVATYYDADGVLQTAAIDEPRLDHDPVTLEPLGLLVEEERTNLFLHSDDPANAYWTKASATVEQSYFLNGLSFFKLIDTTSLSAHSLFKSILGVPAGKKYTMTRIVRKGTISHVQLRFIGPAMDGVDTGGLFNLNDGSFSKIGSAECSSTHVGGGYYRLLITATTKSSGDLWTYLQLHNGATGFYEGTGNGYIEFAANSLEEGGFATSYIPTTVAPVTRSPDICSVKSVDPWIDQNEGTLYAHLNKKAGSYVGNYLTLSDGTANNQVVIKDRSVFYKETNYIPSPFDPISWSAADPDGTKSNITLSNPSGNSLVGDFNITSGNYTFIATFSSFNASIGEKMYSCFIVKNVSADNVFVRFQSDSGTEDQTQISLSTLTKVTGGSDILVTALSDGFSLLQVERVASANLVNADILVYANGDGGQFYAQAAFFGKANDWPAIISDTNVIQAGANNLTGAQSFAAPLESGESKLALSYDGSTYSAAKDGVAFSGVNTGVPALTDLYIGSGEDGSTRYFNGHIIDAQYFPRKLDESELVDLTT